MRAVDTRNALHAMAEHVLAPARYAATGHIGLQATPGGFGTPSFPGAAVTSASCSRFIPDRSQWGEERRMGLTTLGELASFVGVTPGVPDSVYPRRHRSSWTDPWTSTSRAGIRRMVRVGQRALLQLISLQAATEASAIQLA
jgi:hypothetical protein